MNKIELLELDTGDILLDCDAIRRDIALSTRTIESHDLDSHLPPLPSVVLDIGACVGSFAKRLASLGFETHAFEARLDAWMCLAANCRRYRNCFCYHTIVGNGAMCHLEEGTPFGDVGRRRVHVGGDIPSLTIDSLGLQNVGFIKIDVEGFEMQVLEGAAETIRRCRPKMYVEVFPEALESNGASEQSLLAALAGLGYQIDDTAEGLRNVVCVPAS